MAREVPQLGFEGNDPEWKSEWEGMPECVQGLGALPFKTLHVHFATKQDIVDFQKVVDQVIHDTTRYIWFPKSDKAVLKDKRYVDAPEPEEDDDVEIMGEGDEV